MHSQTKKKKVRTWRLKVLKKISGTFVRTTFAVVLLIGILCAVAWGYKSFSPAGTVLTAFIWLKRIRQQIQTFTAFPTTASPPPPPAVTLLETPASLFQSPALLEELLGPPVSIKSNKTALCIAGYAHYFDLAGPSMLVHLLSAYKASDVFINTALDHSSHKLSLLAGLPNLALVQVQAQAPLPEVGAPEAVLGGTFSPAVIRARLQSFHLVEGCLALIDKYAVQQRVQYNWVMYARMDTFWSGPPPPLRRLRPDAYTVPRGSKYFGLNDRLGVGPTGASRVALRRRSMLGELEVRGHRGLNPERVLAAQLAVHNVSVEKASFPFCVLSEAVFLWPLQADSVVVASLGSTAPLNGATCRPCHPALTGSAASKALQQLDGNHRIGATSGVALCNGTLPWPLDWQAIADQVAGTTFSVLRKSVTGRSFANCVSDFTSLVASDAYAGPPAKVVCQLGQWGPVAAVETPKAASAPVHLRVLSSNSTMYSFVSSTDQLSWEKRLSKLVQGPVHVFSPGNRSTAGVRPGGLKNSTLKVKSVVVNLDKVGEQKVDAGGLGEIIPRSGRAKVGLLRVDLARQPALALLRHWLQEPAAVRVCQLVWRLWEGEEVETSAPLAMLKGLGYTLVKCMGSHIKANCLLVNPKFCWQPAQAI